MSYIISDQDRCLGFIKHSNKFFYIYALEDDFILDINSYSNGNQILEEAPIRSLLWQHDLDDFIRKSSLYIRKKEDLFLDFISLYNDQKSDFWDLKDFGLLPSVVIDFDSKELFQIDLELIPSFSKYIPNDWKSYITPNFLDFRCKNKFYEKYPEAFYWIKDNKNYLELIIKRTLD